MVIIAKSEAIQLARIKQGMFQKDIASIVGMTENSYSVLERGARSTTGKTAHAICKTLGLKFDEAFYILK